MSPQAHPNAEKIASVQELDALFQQAKGIYLADFTGLNVEEVNELRRSFHKQQVVYKVVKNTLIRQACQNAGLEDLLQHLQGPTALAISARDPVLPAKLISDFTKGKERQIPVLKAGWLEGAYVGTGDLERVKNIPSREVLLSQILSILQSPLAGLVGTLNEIVRSFLGVLEAIIEKKKAAGEQAPAASAPEPEAPSPSE
jgi:large subunit ribosomal protein L10